MLSVRVIGPAGDQGVFGLADTGADDTMLPDPLSADLGVTSLSAPVLIGGIGGVTYVRFGTVDMEVSDGSGSYRWSARVGFSPHPQPVLGIKGFLQFFTATFNGRLRRLDLRPNGMAPPPRFPVP
jgi:hypothetical protein